MDPTPLSNPEWSDINRILINLWIMVGLVVFSATNAFIGHIFIPSLVASFHLPGSFQKTRPAFYVLSFISGVVTILVLLQVIGQADVLEKFWKDYWI